MTQKATQNYNTTINKSQLVNNKTSARARIHYGVDMTKRKKKQVQNLPLEPVKTETEREARQCPLFAM